MEMGGRGKSGEKVKVRRKEGKGKKGYRETGGEKGGGKRKNLKPQLPPYCANTDKGDAGESRSAVEETRKAKV